MTAEEFMAFVHTILGSSANSSNFWFEFTSSSTARGQNTTLVLPKAVQQAFAVLGIAPTRDKDAVKKAYRSLAKQTHPDLHSGDDTESKAGQRCVDADLAVDRWEESLKEREGYFGKPEGAASHSIGRGGRRGALRRVSWIRGTALAQVCRRSCPRRV